MFEFFKNTLTSNMTYENVEELISENEAIFFDEIEKLIESIKDGTDKKEVIENIHQQCDNEDFCKIAIELISSELIPYEDMEYFRNLEFDVFKEKIDYLFNNTILQLELQEIVRQNVGLNDKEIENSIKLLNTLTGWIVVKRYTYSYFCNEIKDLFRFDSKKTEYLFNLYQNHIKELVNVVLLDNVSLCKTMKSDIKKLYEIIDNIFESENVNEDNNN